GGGTATMSGAGAISLAIFALALLWSGAAVVLSLLAARRFRLAEQVLDAARSNATLLELSPARPLVVRPDDRIEVDPRLTRELGLGVNARPLDDLGSNDGGFAAEDLEQLKEH